MNSGPVVRASATAAVLRELPAAEGLLTDLELARADAFRLRSDRDDFVAAHALVRICAGELLGMPAAELTLEQRCDDCGGPHGRPMLREAPGLSVSLSHSKGHVVAGASRGVVGVDVERLHFRAVDDGLCAIALAPAERAVIAESLDPSTAVLGFWVLKESLVKIGLLSLDRFSQIDLAGLFTTPSAAIQSQLWQGLRLSMWCAGGAVIGQAHAPRA